MNVEDINNNIKKHYDVIFPAENDLLRMITNELNKTGIIYRIFSRKKSITSVCKKMKEKAESKYIPESKKMQDMLGYRVVLYYLDDIDICVRTLSSAFTIDNCERDELDPFTFKPRRINYVFRVPVGFLGIQENISDLCFIDNTFEVQIRTIFSEGWHEVEHDIRYKYLSDWRGKDTLSRELNGVFAVLEMCDHDIISVCDKFAYEKYKDKQWESMIRNKFRLRFQDRALDGELIKIMNDDSNFAKRIYRYERDLLISILSKTKLPINYDNIVYIINYFEIHNPLVMDKTSPVLLKKLNSYNIE